MSLPLQLAFPHYLCSRADEAKPALTSSCLPSPMKRRRGHGNELRKKRGNKDKRQPSVFRYCNNFFERVRGEIFAPLPPPYHCGSENLATFEGGGGDQLVHVVQLVLKTTPGTRAPLNKFDFCDCWCFCFCSRHSCFADIALVPMTVRIYKQSCELLTIILGLILTF
jgi:hypothetical protein